MAVKILETTGTSTFDGIHHRSDRSAPKGKNDVTTKGVIIPRFIYSKLGNWTDVKTYTVESFEDEKNEIVLKALFFKRFF